MIILDSSILVDHLRGRPEATAALHDVAYTRRLGASVVTKVEVMRGLGAQEPHAARHLLTLVRWLPVDELTADVAAEFARMYWGVQPRMDVADSIVAATTMLSDAELWTRNVSRFPMFVDLKAPY